MYIVPHNTPAARAAITPRIAFGEAVSPDEAIASAVAPANIISAPPTTPSHRRQSAPRSSLKKITPQKIPSRLLMFHSGNEMLRPSSRTDEIVRVLSTGDRQ